METSLRYVSIQQINLQKSTICSYSPIVSRLFIENDERLCLQKYSIRGRITKRGEKSPKSPIEEEASANASANATCSNPTVISICWLNRAETDISDWKLLRISLETVHKLKPEKQVLYNYEYAFPSAKIMIWRLATQSHTRVWSRKMAMKCMESHKVFLCSPCSYA